MRYLAGVQPTGRLHVGNYFGFVQSWLKIQESAHNEGIKNVLLIADLHAFTKPEMVSGLQQKVIDCVKTLLALGIDPKHTMIIQQSKVRLSKDVHHNVT